MRLISARIGDATDWEWTTGRPAYWTSSVLSIVRKVVFQLPGIFWADSDAFFFRPEAPNYFSHSGLDKSSKMQPALEISTLSFVDFWCEILKSPDWKDYPYRREFAKVVALKRGVFTTTTVLLKHLHVCPLFSSFFPSGSMRSRTFRHSWSYWGYGLWLWPRKQTGQVSVDWNIAAHVRLYTFGWQSNFTLTMFCLNW